MKVRPIGRATSGGLLIPGNPRLKSFAADDDNDNEHMLLCRVCGVYFDPYTPGATYDDHLTEDYLNRGLPGGKTRHQRVVAALDPEPDLALAAAHNASGVVVAWDMPRSWYYGFSGADYLQEAEDNANEVGHSCWVDERGENLSDEGAHKLFAAPDPAGRIMTYGAVSFDAWVGHWWLVWMFTPKPFRGAGYERRAAVGLRQILGDVRCPTRQTGWPPEVLEVLDATVGGVRDPRQLVASGDGWTAT